MTSGAFDLLKALLGRLEQQDALLKKIAWNDYKTGLRIARDLSLTAGDPANGEHARRAILFLEPAYTFLVGQKRYRSERLLCLVLLTLCYATLPGQVLIARRRWAEAAPDIAALLDRSRETERDLEDNEIFFIREPDADSMVVDAGESGMVLVPNPAKELAAIRLEIAALEKLPTQIERALFAAEAEAAAPTDEKAR